MNDDCETAVVFMLHFFHEVYKTYLQYVKFLLDNNLNKVTLNAKANKDKLKCLNNLQQPLDFDFEVKIKQVEGRTNRNLKSKVILLKLANLQIENKLFDFGNIKTTVTKYIEEVTKSEFHIICNTIVDDIKGTINEIFGILKPKNEIFVMVFDEAADLTQPVHNHISVFNVMRRALSNLFKTNIVTIMTATNSEISNLLQTVREDSTR